MSPIQPGCGLKDSLRWDIREALAEAGVPAIWVTHDQEEALSIGDYMGVLNEGRLEQLDTPGIASVCLPAASRPDSSGGSGLCSRPAQEDHVETPLGPASVRAFSVGEWGR